MNSSEQTYRQKLFLLNFIEPEAFNDATCHSKEELNDCDEEIKECQSMLDYYLATNNQGEIKTWKQFLQQAKTRKRMLRSMIENEITERELLTT